MAQATESRTAKAMGALSLERLPFVGVGRGGRVDVDVVTSVSAAFRTLPVVVVTLVMVLLDSTCTVVVVSASSSSAKELAREVAKVVVKVSLPLVKVETPAFLTVTSGVGDGAAGSDSMAEMAGGTDTMTGPGSTARGGTTRVMLLVFVKREQIERRTVGAVGDAIRVNQCSVVGMACLVSAVPDTKSKVGLPAQTAGVGG